MNVLSLFDGMSCGQIALERAAIKVDNYYASEIDKYAIQVTMANYPNTIQLGDVTKVRAKDLPKIDLMIGGSPCQGFSFAGKGLNFEDERSKLFFEYVRLLNECRPKYFLLENVQMKYEYELIISKYMKVNPIEINAALLSAQNRVRLYWTNINEKPYGLFGELKPYIPQPKDKGILLKDILESEVDEKYYLNESRSKWLFGKGQKAVKMGMASIDNEKALTLTARSHASWNENYVTEKMFQLPHGTNKGGEVAKNGKVPSMTKSSWEHNNLLIEKSPCLHGFEHGTNGQFNNQLVNGGMVRRLTEVECERLQTVPDNYTNHVSSTQRYKMLGNGWTVDVITHILKHIPKSDCRY